MRLAFVLSIALLAPSFAQQVNQVQRQVLGGDSAQPQPAKKKTRQQSAEEQRAKEILEAAPAEWAAFEPGVRAYLCQENARGLLTADRAKAQPMLTDCLRATTEMDDQDKQSKSDLQNIIVRQLVQLGAESAEEFLPQLEGRPREILRGELIKSYVAKKNFDHAIALVQQVQPESEKFPYSGVKEIMQNLPADRAGERTTLFSLALDAFRKTPPPPKDGPRFFENADMGSLIAAFGTMLPKNLSLEAIDEVLSRAKDDDGDVQIGLSNSKGAATFNSMYEYKLFEVLPTLRVLDPSRADDLLKQNAQVSQSLSTFPQGMQSMGGSFGPTPAPKDAKPDFSMRVRMGDRGGPGGPPNGAMATREQMNARYRQQADEIVKSAVDNPKQAIAQALSLPKGGEDGIPPVRPRALDAIAKELLVKDPADAKTAAEELAKSTADMHYEAQMQYLASALKYLLQLGETDAAERILKEGVELGGKLYEKDTDANDPNTAIKPMWPSAGVWRSFILQARKISPEKPMGIINDISDPEIKTFEKLALANAWLGKPGAPRIQEKRKSGQEYFIGDEDE